MKTQYRYLHIGKYGKHYQYFNLDHHPLLLVWRLYWYGKSLGFRRRGVRRTLGDFKRLLSISKTLFYFRRQMSPSCDLLVLPVCGHVCLQVQHGYKVFDLRQQVIIKLFTPDIDLAFVEHEISSVRRVGVHSFAPTVSRWNEKERWYEEDYVNGYPVPEPEWTTFLHTFHESVPPIVARILAAFPLQEVRTSVYAAELNQRIQDILHSIEYLDAAKLTQIRSFVHEMIDCLRLEELSIYLGWSHGDFTQRHVLTTERGTMLIDWEWAAYRNALYDLYDALFKPYRRLRVRSANSYAAAGMTVVIEQAISQLRLRGDHYTSADRVSLIASLETIHVYRWIYYVEKLYLLLGRELTNRRMDIILQFVSAFTHYEAHLQDSASRPIEHVGGRVPIVDDKP